MNRCLYLLLLSLAVGCSTAPATSDSRPADAADGKRSGVILLRYTQGSESTEQREAGFLETMQKEFPDIPILSSNQYSGTTPESSLDQAQRLLTRYGDQVAGIFCVCEPNATGMLGALQEADLAGQVKFVGMDPTPRMVQALADDAMHGIVLQDPVTMGATAVKTMVAHLEGETVDKRISTGEYIATAENMNSDEMKKLLDPQLFEGEEFEPAEKKYVIAVIPKGTTHEFWKSVHAGAENAARELGNVEVRWKGPLQENDREGQINVVQDFITQKVDGICLAPLDAQALVSVVQEAHEEGIPTVIFDSNLDNEEAKVSYVATDNYVGGALAARRLGALLSGDAAAETPATETPATETPATGTPANDAPEEGPPETAPEPAAAP